MPLTQKQKDRLFEYDERLSAGMGLLASEWTDHDLLVKQLEREALTPDKQRREK
jgi:hypothetical protein